MTNERLSELMAYLHVLKELNQGDYRCSSEITEAIKAVRKEIFMDYGTIVTTDDIESDAVKVKPALKSATTAELTEELAKREGVRSAVLNEKYFYTVDYFISGNGMSADGFSGNGPVHIYVVTD